MAVALTIAGATKTLRRGTLRLSETSNGRATCAFSIVSVDASYRPALDAEVILTDGATRIFGGLLEHSGERGVADIGSNPGIVTNVSCVDFHAYTDRRFVNETIPAGTLKAALTVVVGYLSSYGVTLHASQVNGPAIPELIYDYKKATDVLNDLVRLTADAGETFVWRIDNFKVLRAYQPSTTAAPFNITSNTPAEVIGDITVETSREHYANRVIVKVPSKTETNRVETFTGDGATDTFQLQYQLSGHRGYVTNGGNYETFTTVPGDTATWTYDSATNELIRSSPPTAGATISIPFDGTFVGQGIAEDAAEIASVGLWEKVVVVESVPTDETAQSIAESELAISLPVVHTLKYKTRELLAPGMSQTVTLTARNLDGTAVITDVNTSELGDPGGLVRAITAVIDDAQTNLGRGWRDTYKTWAGDKAGGSVTTAAIGTGTAPPTQAGPGAPTRSVQFNRDGVFGGDADFTYDESTDSIVCGGGGSAITAGNPVSCQVFGYNNYITDP